MYGKEEGKARLQSYIPHNHVVITVDKSFQHVVKSET